MQPNRPTIRVSDPVELLSVVPYTLGFQPRQSLVIMSLRESRLLSVGRIDLPDILDPTDLTNFRASLHDLATILDRHGAGSVIVAGYGPADLVGTAVRTSTDVFRAAGLPVRDTWRISDGRYFNLGCDDPACCPIDGQPFDPTSTVVAATATLAGWATASDRDELLSQLTPIGGAARDAFAEATTAVCAGLVERLDAAGPATGDDEELSAQSPLGRELLHEAQQAVTTALACYRSGQPVDDDLAAFLTVLVHLTEIRDALVFRLTGEAGEVQMWSDLVRRAEPDFVANTANLLAISALLAGNGVLASLATARAIDADPGNRLARLVRSAVAIGISPAEVVALLTR
jgi:hypothetical protein